MAFDEIECECFKSNRSKKIQINTFWALAYETFFIEPIPKGYEKESQLSF
jgi:hypothetical protein